MQEFDDIYDKEITKRYVNMIYNTYFLKEKRLEKESFMLLAGISNLT